MYTKVIISLMKVVSMNLYFIPYVSGLSEQQSEALTDKFLHSSSSDNGSIINVTNQDSNVVSDAILSSMSTNPDHEVTNISKNYVSESLADHLTDIYNNFDTDTTTNEVTTLSSEAFFQNIEVRIYM